MIGSSNTDLIIRVPRIPRAGETLLGGEFMSAAGGKGANQAVGAARSGGKTALIARVGTDAFGDRAVAGLRRDGVDVTCVFRDKRAASGVALIFVARDGENSIAVAGGANARLSPADVNKAAGLIRGAALLVAQLETPLATVIAAALAAVKAGVPVILNPAPARALPNRLLKLISILTPNETEAELLTGIKVTDEAAAARACAKLRSRGVRTVILTLGARGAYLADDGRTTTGARLQGQSRGFHRRGRHLQRCAGRGARRTQDPARCGSFCQCRGGAVRYPAGRAAVGTDPRRDREISWAPQVTVEMLRRICVFCGSSAGARPAYRQAAQTVGRLLCRRGIELVYGGGHVGLMGIVADACLSEGGRVIGVIPQALADKEVAHSGLTELRIVKSMHERKSVMAELSDAFLALPGGYGTWEELFEVLTWSQLGIQRKACALLNVEGYYDPLLAMADKALADGFLRGVHRDLLLADIDPERLLDRLSDFEVRAEPGISPPA